MGVGVAALGAAGVAGRKVSLAEDTWYRLYLPYAGTDVGSGPVQGSEGLFKVMDTTAQSHRGGFIARDRLWLLGADAPNDGFSSHYCSGTTAAPEEIGLTSNFFVRATAPNGVLRGAQVVPLSQGLDDPFQAEYRHWGGIYSAPPFVEPGDRVEGWIGLERAAGRTRLYGQRLENAWQITAFDSRPDGETARVSGIATEPYLDPFQQSTLAYDLKFPGGNTNSLWSFNTGFREPDEWEAGFETNGSETRARSNPLLDVAPFRALTAPEARVLDYRIGQESNQLFFTVVFPGAVGDFIPSVSLQGGPPVPGQPVKLSIESGQTIPLIFNFPKGPSDSFGPEDWAVTLLPGQGLSAAGPLANVRSRRPALVKVGPNGPWEVTGSVVNPLANSIASGGANLDLWVVERDPDAEILETLALGAHPFPLELGSAKGFAYRQSLRDIAQMRAERLNEYEQFMDELVEAPAPGSEEWVRVTPLGLVPVVRRP